MSDQRPTKIILAEVIAVIPEYHQTCVRTDSGYQYAIVESTKGIHWSTLKEGDMIELEVYTAIPIVKEVLHVV